MRSPVWATALRVVLLLVFFLVLAIGAGIAEDQVLEREAPSPNAALVGVGALLVVATLTAILLRLLRPRVASAGWAGFPLADGAAGRFVGGVLLGGAMLGGVAGIGLVLGWYEVVAVLPINAVTLAILGFGLVAATVGAFVEEGVFRGGLYSEARARFPFWLAVLLVSLPFAGLHLLNSGFGLPFVVAAVLASVFMAATRERTGDLWFALGWHAAWNAMQYAVVGIATTDAPFRGHALVQVERTGTDLWLGQGQSIEGGLLAGGAIFVAAVIVLSRRTPTAKGAAA